jgi:hypothetical protein
MAGLYVSDATKTALGISKTGTQKTTRQMLGLDADPAAEALKAAQNTALTKGMTAGVGTDLAATRTNALSKANALTFDRSAQEQAINAQTDLEAQQQRERLARQFGIDAGGAQSGASQRAFEDLESGVLATKANTRTQLLQMEGDQLRANLASVGSIYSQMSDVDLAAEAQRLAATQAAGQQLSQDEQNLLTAYQAVGQQGVSEQQAAEAATMGAAQRTALTAETSREDLNAAMARATQQGQLTGMFVDPATKASLETLQSKAQTFDQGIASRQMTEAEAAGGAQRTALIAQTSREDLNAAIARATQQGQMTGSYVDPQTGVSLQTLQAQAQQAELTGKIGGQAFSIASVIGPAGWKDLVAKSTSGQLTTAEQSALLSKVSAAYKQMTGVDPTPEQMQQLWYGQTITTPASQTEAARATGVQESLAEAQLTGEYGKNKTETLAAKQQAVDALNAAMARAVQNGQMTGKFVDPEDKTATPLSTLQAQLQTANIDLQKAQLAMQGQQFLTEQTGRVNGGGPVSAAEFGISTTGNLVNGQLTPQGNENYSKLVAALNAAGIQATDAQIKQMLGGTSVAFAMGATLAARAQGAVVTQAQQKIDNEKALNDANLALQRAEQSGVAGKDPVTGRDIPTLQAEIQRATLALQKGELTGTVDGGAMSAADLGIDIQGMSQFDAFFTLQGELDSRGLMKDKTTEEIQSMILTLMSGNTIQVAGTQTLAAKLQEANIALQRAEQSGVAGKDPVTGKDIPTLQAEIQRAQLALQQQTETNRQTEARAGITGTIATTAQDLGVNVASYKGANGTLSTAGVLALQKAFYAKFGRIPTADEQNALASGQGITVEGGKTLAAREVSVAEKSQAATEAVQKGQLTLAQQQELARQREAQATATGQWQTQLTPLQLGVDPSQWMGANGQPDLDAFFNWVGENDDTWNAVEESFRSIMGRDMSIDEINAIVRGQTINGTYAPTLAKQQLDNEKESADNAAAIARAEQSGLLWDPETKQNVDTLQKKQVDLQTRQTAIQEQQQAWQQKMDLANQTGYVAVGNNGVIGAADLGVDTQYLKQMPAADRVNTNEAQRIKSAYKTLTGNDLTLSQLSTLLDGTTINTGKEIRVETAAARAQREQTEMSWSEVSGKIGQAKTEAARQFDQTLADRTDLTEAQVGQIQASIRQADTELQNNFINATSEQQLKWAELLGEGYSSGSVNAKTLGVTLPANPPNTWDQATRDNVTNTVTQAFKAMTGKNPTAAELNTILSNGSAAVTGSPTMAAKALAAQVSTQELERQTDVYKFSQQYGLDNKQLTQAITEQDRQYNLSAKQVANAYQLDQQKFSEAKAEAMATLTGKIGVNGQLSATDLGVALPAGSYYTWDNDQLTQVANDIKTTFKTLQGRDITGSELSAILQGGNVGVNATYTMGAKEFAAQQAEIANRYGLDVKQFAEASEQFDKQYTMNNRNALLQLVGAANIDANGNVIIDTTKPLETTDYQKYQDALADYNKTEGQRDLVWQKFIYNNSSEQKVTGQEMVNRGLLPENWRQMTNDAIVAEYYKRTGFAIAPDQVERLKSGTSTRDLAAGQIQTQIPAMSNNDIATMSDMINGHSAAVASANSATGWSSLAGSIIGQTVSAVATEKLSAAL